MKRTVTREETHCDLCGTQDAYNQCPRCGKDICFECGNKPELVTKYSHAVYASGSGDGYYCKSCDDALFAESLGGYRLHRAYVEVRALRTKANDFYSQHQADSKLAEQEVQDALREAK